MPIARIYQALSLQPGMQYRLSEKASHHIAHVLRARRGEKLFIFNGEGGEYAAIIQQIDKKGVEVAISHFIAREAEPPVAIHLAQGIARGDKMDFIVQKAVELGVNTVVPVVTEHCNLRLTKEREAKRLQHWQAIAISACEQCGRNRLPIIEPPQLLADWLTTTQVGQRFVLSPHQGNKLSAITLVAEAATLLIGPEGGLSHREIKQAMQQGFVTLNLGPRILRTETATIVALAVMQAVYGDLQ